MTDFYARGQFKMGDIVMSDYPAHLKGRIGVVCQMSDRILSLLKPGEVPVRYVLDWESRMKTAETYTMLLDAKHLRRIKNVADR